MFNADQLNSLRDILGQANQVVVVLGSRPSFDQVVAALALAQTVRSAGKEVEVAAPNQLEAVFLSLAGANQVKQKLGNRNLTLSFPYQEEAVDKVSYHISDDNSTFYLVIKPRKGHKPLSAQAVEFDYSGAEADLVFLIGVHDYEQLEHLYQNYKSLYENAAIITIHNFEPGIGNLKFDVSSSGSMSEAMVWLLEATGLQIDTEAATILLQGIEQATNSFQSLTMTADTFEVVAKLMRAGARRVRRSSGEIEQDRVNVDETNLVNHAESKPARQEQNTVFGQALQQKVAAHQPITVNEEQGEVSASSKLEERSKSKKKHKQTTDVTETNDSKPGDLNYQPKEGGVGRG